MCKPHFFAGGPSVNQDSTYKAGIIQIIAHVAITGLVIELALVRVGESVEPGVAQTTSIDRSIDRSSRDDASHRERVASPRETQ